MKNMEADEICKVSEEQKTSDMKYIGDKKSELLKQTSKLPTEISIDCNVTESAEPDSCIRISDFVNDDISTAEIYKSSINEIAVSEEISEFVSDTCETVPIIVSDSSVEISKRPVNEIAILEEVSKLVLDTCIAVENIINDTETSHPVDNIDSALNTVTTDSESIPETFETANDDLYNAEINEKDEECANSLVETDAKDSVRRERHWTEQASLPYYREPKPDFFEYTRKMQEELDPKLSVSSSSVPNDSSCIIVLDDPVESSNHSSDLIKSPASSGIGRNKKSTAFDLYLEKTNGIPSEKPSSGLIILDDYKSPRVKNSHFSRSSDLWNLSNLSSTKEKPEPVPGAKYKALKEQLMEKIMLKKEESFNKRKEEQEVDEELFEEEEEIVSDEAPDESENGSSDEDMDNDSPDYADEDDEVLKDMLLKECKAFPENISGETNDSCEMKDETEQLNPAVGEDSQEPMECYSLPSYQPGGGFVRSPFQKRNTNTTFSDSDINDSAMSSPSQQISSGRIFSDSDFIDSGPSGSLEFNQLKNTHSLELKDNTYEPLPFDDNNEHEIIPHWESLPVSEKQGSQLFDEDISVICSGKFPSTNEDIPWTPSSSVKNSFPDKEPALSPPYNNHANNDPDPLNDSDDEELVRPAKKIKLSLVEKLWDSEDEEDVGSKELKRKPCPIQSDEDDNDADTENDFEPEADSDEEIDDHSERLHKPAIDAFKELLAKDGNNEEPAKKFEINNFFENEAELSGEEGSSDENEDDVDEYMDDEMITDEIVASEEKLRKEVGTIHLKRLQDEDEQIIRQLKEDFLPEGELYNENGQRKRRYIWNNIGMDNNEFTENKSDSEEEEIESLPTDYLKWQQEKNKSNLPEDEDVVVQTPKSIGLKVDIVGKVSVTRCSGISNSSISASPMLRRGSFLNSSIGKNMKFIKEFSSSEGSVSRKNFVFSSPQPNRSLSSTPVLEVKSTKINTSINNRSIFNKI